MKLTYVEGEMFTGAAPHKTIRACWLADENDEAICVVTKGASDFDKCCEALKYAAFATQQLPDILAACEQMLPYLSNQNELLNYAATNDGRASGFDSASVAIRRAIQAAKENSHVEQQPV